jgi:hypothetical protein
VEVVGILSRQGPDLDAVWAVTDDAGRIWEIVSPTPDQVALLTRLQNSRVVVRARRLERMNFERLHLLEIRRSCAGGRGAAGG